MAEVNKTHPEYDEMLPVWTKARDVAGGTRKLHAKTVEYLPKLTDEDDPEYKARLERTVLYNATWRTVVGFLGLLFRKPAVTVIPESVKYLAEDITNTGVPLDVFALEVSEETLLVGRSGIWDNYPVAAEGITLADAQRLKLRPSMQLFVAEAIYNWKVSQVNNKTMLSQVRLRENHVVEETEFTSKTTKRFRVLDLTPTGKDDVHIYRVRVFEVNDKDEDVLVEGPFYPKMGGKNLEFIPFYFISPDDTTTDVEEPPFIDLIDVNLSHYRVTADYENGCHWSGIPTMVITGHSLEAGGSIKVGAGNAIVLPNPLSKADMVEVGVSGFPALEKNLDRKEAQMVVLGARLLEVQKPGIEAAETALIHRAGEQSILSTMAQTISTGISMALTTLTQWAGADGEARYDLNRDFFHTPMTPEMFKAVVEAWQNKGISAETRFALLKKGEVYSPGAKFEDEQALIDADKSQGDGTDV